MVLKVRADVPKSALPDSAEPRANSVIHFSESGRTGLFQGWGPKL